MITPSTVWRRMKKTASAVGIPVEDVHAHAFRHFFAREFMKKYGYRKRQSFV
jgi:site-specific recombinase XerD